MKIANQVDADLKSNKWSNDTLSPLSTKEYFKLCENLVEDDELAKSALMALSISKTFGQQKNMIVATDKRIAIARKKGGIRYKNLYVDYANVLDLKISQDYYMPSRIYVTFKYQTKNKSKFLNFFFGKKLVTFEVMDPTSTFHFKRFLDQKIKRYVKLHQDDKQK